MISPILLRIVRGRSAPLLPLVLFATACGVFRARNAAESRDGTTATTPSQVVRELDSKPSLLIVARDGDPAAALAFAAKSNAGSEAIWALSHILRYQLKSAPMPLKFELFPNGFGLTISALVDSPEQARAAVETLNQVLSRPITATFVSSQVLDELRASLPRSNVSRAERALASCTGELVIEDTRSEAQVVAARAERARVGIRSLHQARFAIVGSRNIADAVERALQAMPRWPSTRPPVEPAPGSTSGISTSVGATRHLSAAWYLGKADTARSAAAALRRRGSPLLSQVAAFGDEWKIDGISSTARDIGGCLRIDLSNSSDNSNVTRRGVQEIVRVVTSEVERAIVEAANSKPSISLTLEADPSRAARGLAWNALSVPGKSKRDALLIHLRTLPNDATLDLETVIRDTVTAKSVAATFDSTVRQEFGQTELWALLASRCAATSERAIDAGSTAAWLQTLVRRFDSRLGVRLEPFVTEDGLGLFAHTPPQTPGESPADIAKRLGDALGSVVATGSIDGPELAITREDNLLRVGPSPRSAWWQLVDTLSAGQPSTFEPLGTLDSLRTLDLNGVRQKRATWLNGPLKLAALLNRNREQRQDLEAALHRWLDPHRQSVQPCQPITSPRSSQVVNLATRTKDDYDPNVYVAIQLAPSAEPVFTYEHWLLWLLARPGGWLDTSLVHSGNLTAYTADIKGPAQNRAVIIGFDAQEESKFTEAVTRIRDLFERVSKRGAEANELEQVQAWSVEQIRRAELDPRRRLVDLWRGDSVPQKPQKSAFSRYLARSLASAPMTVVRVRATP